MAEIVPPIIKPGSYKPGSRTTNIQHRPITEYSPPTEKDSIGLPLLKDLPINTYAKEIQKKVIANDVVIIVGETGSGKTTQIPLILRSIVGKNDRIAITQPRRVAARSVARFVSEQVGCNIGEEVGYKVRFDDKTTEGTLVNFMTDGILLRQMLQDPLLRDYSIVMVDEAHERSMNIDLTLGLLKNIQEKRKKEGLPQLKIVVTSATLEKEKFSRFFNSTPIVDIPGRLYPVSIHYEDESVSDYKKAAAEKVKKIVESGEDGDILIFMPGKEDIDKTTEEIRKFFIQDINILPLHGELSPEDQDKIFDSNDKKRKVIIATNIAETSITVPGVKHVIDSGFIKQTEYNTESGIESLEVTPHSKSGCVQRAGRAGRIAPGNCYRLFTKQEFEERDDFQLPEIQRSNIALVVLQMKQMGIDNVETFDFIDPPHETAFNQAIISLTSLGALDSEGNLTEIGRIMAELPLEPHISRMVIEAEKHGCVDEVCTIAAFLGNRSVFNRPKGKEIEADRTHSRFKNPESDFITLLNVWKEYENIQKESLKIEKYWERQEFIRSWINSNFLNKKVLDEVESIRTQLFSILERNGIEKTSNTDKNAVGKSIAIGLADNLCKNSYRYEYLRLRDAQGGIYIHPSSATLDEHPQFLVAVEIVTTSKTFARTCQVVKPEWVKEIAPSLVSEIPERVFYDWEKDQVVCIYSQYIKYDMNSFYDEERQITGEKAVEVFATVLAQSPSLGAESARNNHDVINTLKDLYVRSEGKTKPPPSLNDLIEFYKTRLGNIASLADLKKAQEEGKVDIALKIDDFINPEERKRILADNPDEIYIGEKSYPVSYVENTWGEDHFIAHISVPAEETFGIKEFPKIPSGKKTFILLVDRRGNPLIKSDNLEKAKREAKEHLIADQWESWASFPRDKAKKDLPNFDINAPLELPEPVEFGIDPETKEPLMAYPAVVRETYFSLGRDFYSITYFPTKEKAERALRELEIHKESKRAPKETKTHPPGDFLRDLPKAPSFSFFDERSLGPTRRNKPEREQTALEKIMEKETEELIRDYKMLKERQNSKPRVKALTQAVLIEKGIDVMEKAGIKKDDFPEVLKELDLAVKEAKGKYNREEIIAIENLVLSVEKVKTAINQSESDTVKDFIGDSKEEKQRFQKLFLEILENKKLPKTKEEMEGLIDQVLEKMTS